MILELENKIMEKYGYTIEDFDDSENRDLFDWKRDSSYFIVILNKYFAKPIQHKVLADLNEYDKRVNEYNNLLTKIDKFVGFEFSSHYYIDLLDFFSRKKVEVRFK